MSTATISPNTTSTTSRPITTSSPTINPSSINITFVNVTSHPSITDTLATYAPIGYAPFLIVITFLILVTFTAIRHLFTPKPIRRHKRISTVDLAIDKPIEPSIWYQPWIIRIQNIWNHILYRIGRKNIYSVLQADGGPAPDSTSEDESISKPRKRAGIAKSTWDIEMQTLPTYEHIPVMHVGNSTHTPILTHAYVEQLVPFLPPLTALRDLTLLYSTTLHGASMITFDRKVAMQGATLLIARDEQDYIFGCFCSSSWQRQGVQTTYYGEHPAMVLTLSPHFACYPSTDRNEWYQLSRDNTIAVGGGDDFALWFDTHFREGRSKPCATFASPTLASSTTFRVYELEVWGFT